MRLQLLVTTACALVWASPASADTICEWMDFAKRQLPQGPPPSTGLTQVVTGEGDRAGTQVALAMFEALNAIDRRYRSYVGMPLGDAGASQQVAAITAATTVLLAHPAARKTELEEGYQLALAGIPESRAKASGVMIGKQAAAAALTFGNVDSKVVQRPYRPVAAPGQWVPTAMPATRPYSLAFRPWIMTRPDEVRPSAPPKLNSSRYARDLNEVKRLGARTSSERTGVETLMARYRITSDEMPALRTLVDQDGRRLVDNARIFALYTMLGNDLGMAVSDAKLHYNFWRPITAIRNADRDDNSATQIDPTWEPLMNTPNHGEYPCGHCIFAAGVAELMTSVGGNRPKWGVRVGSESLPSSAVQVLPDWNEWVRQVSYSRILGGVHYRFSNEAAETMGRKLAKLALERVLQPLPASEIRPAISAGGAI
jgi:hypothetical protein